jgi:hypothetical protein
MLSADYIDIVQQFDRLPDDAIFPDPLSAKVLGCSVWTLQRNNPVPRIQISQRRFGRRVGDIRALARGKRPGA